MTQAGSAMNLFDPETGMLALPWWSAVAIALLVVLLGLAAASRAGWRSIASVVFQLSALLVIGLLGFNYFDRMTSQEAAAEWRAFEQRLVDLDARVMQSDSALACLDNLSGPVVGDACEKTLFGKAETVAGAAAYVAARIALYNEATSLYARGHLQAETRVRQLRQFLERDRFGFVAQVLALRYGCTVDSCMMLSSFDSPARIVDNLRERTFEVNVGRYVGAWRAGPQPAAAAPGAAPASQANAATPATSAVNIDFPSAASIPPVSIMNNEPGMTGQTGADAPPKAAERDGKPAPAQRAVAPAATPSPRPVPRTATSPGAAARNTPAPQAR